MFFSSGVSHRPVKDSWNSQGALKVLVVGHFDFLVKHSS